jgi:site-specific DNA-methyltransferase (adenine-specific)
MNSVPEMNQKKALEKKYASIIREQLSLRPYLSFSENESIPFLNLYRYEEAFSFFLVKYILSSCHASEKDYVIDPFCGSGVTLFTAFMQGIPSIGTDVFPFACFLSRTLPLFTTLPQGHVKQRWKSICETMSWCDPAPVVTDIPPIKDAFQPEILNSLRKMKTAISMLSFPYKDVFLYLFFSILEECSTFSRIKRYWTPVKDNPPLDPILAMDKKVTAVEQDILQVKKFSIHKARAPAVYLADIRQPFWHKPLPRTPTLLITSPPYADTVDYTETYAVELGFHFVKDMHEFRKMKEGFLRSYLSSSPTQNQAHHPVVWEICTALEATTPSSPVIPMIRNYFTDMQDVFTAWYTQLGDDAVVAMVLQNLEYQGYSLPVDLIFCDMAQDSGFSIQNIVVANYKKRKKGETGLLRESILFWKKS